jgi:serine/threonine protein kinase
MKEYRLRKKRVFEKEQEDSFLKQKNIFYLSEREKPEKIMSVKIGNSIICIDLDKNIPIEYNSLKKKFDSVFKNQTIGVKYYIVEKLNKGCHGNVYKMFSFDKSRFVIGKHSKTSLFEYNLINQTKSVPTIEYISKYNMFVMEMGNPFKYNERMTFKNKKVWVQKLLENVKRVHDEGYIHADIKPENIVIIDNTPFLIDFSCSHSIKETKIVTGTPSYMNKETICGFSYPYRDIWAVCMSFLFLEIGITFFKFLENNNYPIDFSYIDDYMKLCLNKKIRRLLKNILECEDAQSAIGRL